ncbi:hypothetical protein AMTRI_Chr08g210340 [Amborella trichopoda]
MEQKQLLTALGVGLGVGLGFGFASGTRWSSSNGPNLAENVEIELMKLVSEGKHTGITFDEFPYYLSEQTKMLLTNSAYVHLKQTELSKYTRNLSSASKAILLSGPAEPYQQMLAKALAQHFEAKLLLFDVTDFSLKIQSKYGSNNNGTEVTSSNLMSSKTFDCFSNLLERLSIPSLRDELGLRGAEGTIKGNGTCNSGPSSSGAVTAKRSNQWAFDEKLLVQSLYKVISSVSKTTPIILYLRDIEKLLSKSQRMYSLSQKMISKLSGPVLILGSRIYDHSCDKDNSIVIDEKVLQLFPYKIEVKPPENDAELAQWKIQLEEDMKVIQVQDNRNHITEVLTANNLDCDDLSSICVADTEVLSNYIEEIVMSAFSHHLKNNESPEYRNGKLVISAKSLAHGLSLFQEDEVNGNDSLQIGASSESVKETQDETGSSTEKTEPKAEAGAPENKTEGEKSGPAAKKESDGVKPLKEVVPDNEFEKRVRQEVIPASDIGVTFSDIGALEDTKKVLEELVMLPLRRPDLFKGGGLLRPCRGILLFGPPGTGKTMLAKAIAKEAGASFINMSMSSVTSKWFGEDEKTVRAVFTLAAKLAPTIIFIDEVDSMLGQRSRTGEHEAMRKIKNEFMAHWDGLLTKSNERILVLAATNRPFDLDEAIIRRFERRIMVGLPSVESREMILRTLLAKEATEELDFKELASMTEGYSGSDLKNLCTTAAYRPVRELLKKEIEKEKEKKQESDEISKEKSDNKSEANEERPESSNSSGKGDEEAKEQKKEEEAEAVIPLRPLTMDDLRQAKNQVAPSFASEGAVMSELQRWNDLYGEGGSRKKQTLSYFL